MPDHSWPDSPAGQLLARLEQHYGKPAPPSIAGPFEMILWEIVAYLADDARRAAAFDALRDHVGLTPQAILAAPQNRLLDIARLGGSIAFADRAERLQSAARLAIDECGGDFAPVLKLPAPKAKKLLMKFPMIGEPGAEKILLFSDVLPVLALDSNGARVLVRYGVGEERRSYAATYRSIREATLDQLPADCGLLTAAHLLLKRHGQQICSRKSPSCGSCPVHKGCRYLLAAGDRSDH